MKINKEKFNKLSQLDRIEFRQRYDLINKKYGLNLSVNYMGIMMILGLLFINTGISGYEILGSEFLSSMNNISRIIVKFVFIYIGIEIIVGLYYLYKRKKLIEELEREYFRIEVKRKK